MEGEPPQTTNYKFTKNHYEHKYKVKTSKITSKQNENENTRTSAKTAAPHARGGETKIRILVAFKSLKFLILNHKDSLL